MKNKLPKCPLNDGASEDAWLEGLEDLMEELKYEEELPFKNSDEIFEEVCYILEEEDLNLDEDLKTEIRKLFDQLWPQYKS